MKKTYVYIISLAAFFIVLPSQGQESPAPPDSVVVPLKIYAGAELAGPVIYFTDRSTLNFEAYLCGDINEKMSAYLSGGWSDYKYTQYNYDFLLKGSFLRAGVDFNLLRPEKAEGKYWAGTGIRYGLSRFTSETPELWHENYWGRVTSSLPERKDWGHFLEVSGGFRAELFRSFNIGWTVSVRKLIYTGAPKDTRPVFIPGYGETGKSFAFGINYYISFSIPYKKIKVQIKPEPVEEPEEGSEAGTQNQTVVPGR